jgi:hypothetical protein
MTIKAQAVEDVRLLVVGFYKAGLFRVEFV